jgi:hypothetical protein
MLCVDHSASSGNYKWLGIFWAFSIALVLIILVLDLVACSTSPPTLVPTLAMPTRQPSPKPSLVSSQAVTDPFLKLDDTLAVAYQLDPATGDMVPSDRVSGVAAENGAQLWVVTDQAFVEYHRANPGELVAFKVITYTYDDIGRRAGWTISWPQGPTATQRLFFLYEGLVAVGERLEIGDVVTTTYYPWATRDRNTTVDATALGSNAAITDVTRYDARCQATAGLDCVTLLARVIVSEASVGNEDEQRAVAWTFRNRLDRSLSVHSYAMDQAPNQEFYFELAREVLTDPPEVDLTKGATHFFSPRSMPLQGQEARCKSQGGIYDCDGGLVLVEGLEAPAYAPFWHLLYEWLPVSGIRKTHFLFYRIPPIRPRVGQ